MACHNPDFGVVFSDGCESRPLADGTRERVEGRVARKFVVLRPRPKMILAGTSSLTKWFDFAIYEAVRRFVEMHSQATFDDVRGAISSTVQEAFRGFNLPADPRLNLNLLGFDSEQQRVRCTLLAFRDCDCEESEHEAGASVSGFVEPEEGFARELLDRMCGEQTLEAACVAMQRLAVKISASRPEAVGPPYFFDVVTMEERA